MAKNNNLGETPITEKDYSTDQEFEYEKVFGFGFEFPTEKENVITMQDVEGRDYSGALRSAADRSFVNEFMREKARVMNQHIRYRMKEVRGIDIMPVYLQWDARKMTMLTHVRTDWLKAKIEAELSFPKWLRKQGKYRWSGIAETFIRNKTKSTDSSPSPWWNKMYEQYLEDTKDDPKYSKLKKTGFPILHLQEERGQRPTQGLRKSDDIDLFIDERIGDSTEKRSQLYRQYFLRPMKDDDFKKMLSPKNKGTIWGDDMMKQYIKDNEVNMEDYNKTMEYIQDMLFREIKKIDFKKEWDLHEKIRKETNPKKHGSHQGEDYFNQAPSKQNFAQQQVDFQPEFPNIEKLAKWFTESGIIHASTATDANGVRKHKFNADSYMRLSSNQARANFIDSAVFLIGLSIYEKNGGVFDLRGSIEKARQTRSKNRGQDKRNRRQTDYDSKLLQGAATLTRNLNYRRRTNRAPYGKVPDSVLARKERARRKRRR
jgi:hypothetical protein